MPSEYETDSASSDGVNTLPDDARAIYQTLTREGASWRRVAAPEIERVNQRLRAQVTRLSAERPTDAADAEDAPTRRIAQPLVTVSAPAGYAADRAGRTPATSAPHGSTRLRRWVTMGATLAVILAFVGVLSLAANRPNGAGSAGVNGVTGVTGGSPLAGGWTALNSLDYVASFSANEPPAVAPSDPRVVYETMAQGMQEHQPASMRATSDGGKTWRTLPLPVPADHVGYAGVGVSPVNARTVFLSLIDTTAAECPANRVEPLTEAGSGAFCRLQYTSVDGGLHWRATNLPLAGGSHPGLLTASINSGAAGPVQSDTVRAQGQRLFAGYICTDFSCTRLVTSDDGGLTWSFADLPMLANGAANICDFDASKTGATLYAVSSASDCGYQSQAPLKLWTSHDAGASWTVVGQLATPNERGMLLTQNRSTGATLLYMALPRTTGVATDKMGGHYPIISEAPNDVQVSVDGGQTWQPAPTQGIPTNHALYLNVGLLGTLSDGSVVVDVIPTTVANAMDADNFSGSDLYAWRPGDAAWQKLASVPREIDALIVTPAPSGTADTLYAMLVDRSGTDHPFTVARCNVAR